MLQEAWITENNIETKVSIVIPAYQAEETLGRCLKSCMRQSLLEIEVILVLNGEDTEEIQAMQQIALHIQSQNKTPLRILTLNECGVSRARNAGMKIAKGRYLTFVDADDLIAKDFCKSLYILAEMKQLDVVGIANTELGKDVFGEQAFYCLDLCAAWGKLYRRAFLESGKLLFSEELTYGEDQVFVREAFAKTDAVATCGSRGYLHIERARSLSLSYHEHMKECLLRCEEARKRAVEKHPVIDSILTPGEVQTVCMQVFNLYSHGAPYKASDRCEKIRKIALEAKAVSDPLRAYLPKAGCLEGMVLRNVLKQRSPVCLDLLLFIWKNFGVRIRRLFRKKGDA